MSRLEPLGNRVRLAVARHLVRQPRASASEVAEAVGVHLNTARAHLTALEEGGLARRISHPSGGRGRPVVRYQLVDDWVPEGDELLSLSALLAAAVSRLDAESHEVRRLGAAWGCRWARESGQMGVEEQLSGALGRLGFGTRLAGRRLTLTGCPCPLVAPDSPELICGLADAVVDGVLEGSELVAGGREHDPRARRCSTRLRAA
jgi:predicted ArsR family transcriptional regulator